MSEMSCWVCSLGQAHSKCSFCGVALCEQCVGSHEKMEEDMRAVEDTETEEEAGDEDVPWPDNDNEEDE